MTVSGFYQANPTKWTEKRALERVPRSSPWGTPFSSYHDAMEAAVTLGLARGPRVSSKTLRYPSTSAF